MPGFALCAPKESTVSLEASPLVSFAFTPMKNTYLDRRILDMGTGTGIWAIESELLPLILP